MENPSSPLDTLRQLKEMLDAGALTPTEFEALKQRLVFAPAASAAPDPAAAPVAPARPAPVAHAPPAVLPTRPPDFLRPGQSGSGPAPHEVEVDALGFEPVAEPLFVFEASADFPVVAAGPGYVPVEAPTTSYAAEPANPPAEQNSSLGLLLAIAGVLVFLAVVAYLGFTQPASEHISSTSQTAADSIAAPIETGPQVAPLPVITAVPETVRVAPANPAPVLPSRVQMADRAKAIRDSAAAASPVAPDSAGRQ